MWFAVEEYSIQETNLILEDMGLDNNTGPWECDEGGDCGSCPHFRCKYDDVY